MADAATLPVLICGAGPTGLALALSLARRGIEIRIVDEAPAPGLHSRAMVVHARILELYRQFGIADRMVGEGIRIERIRVREGGGGEAGEEIVAVGLSDLGRGLSPYPFVLCYPQDDHERFLIRELQGLGIEVDRGRRLVGFSTSPDDVTATLDLPGGRREVVRARYLCGCDGAHSQVRHGLGVDFPGGTYEQLFFVADVRLAGEFETDLTVNLGRNLFALRLPVRSSGMQRLIGLVPPHLPQQDDIGFEQIHGPVEELLAVRVEDVNWFSTYRVHHRVAQHFRQGRVFILGDAGHIHSPAGGQGMNTGIGDAINLGWKLAAVLGGRAPDALLDSYEAERIAFARRLVSTTDRAFTLIVEEGTLGILVRRLAVPLVLSAGLRFAATRRTFFRTVSQIGIRYPESPLSSGRAGRVTGGDRLPWLEHQDNFAPLRSLDWQLHLYGEPTETIASAARTMGLPLHRFARDAEAVAAGFDTEMACLVRPDGHVGLVAAVAEAPARLADYAARLALNFG
jgi:2-polyprenyl-6-methoxyphenol hydroxylase-like FAD-dependent oxidoreductase